MTTSDHPLCSYAAHLLGRFTMAITGWKVEGGLPASSKMLIIAAPHTTNWDLIYLLGAAFTLHLSINWLGKDSLFKWGAGPLMRFTGGVPVNRSKHTNMVAGLVEEVGRRDEFALVVPPAGTRGYTPTWKSGFYWIAHGAQIPLVCGYLDYDRKVAGLGLSFIPTGNVKADMDRIREFYAPIAAKYPEKKSTILLREEM